MSTNADDADDEYLDDPISLMAIEDIKTEIFDDYEDQIIDVSDDDEDTYTSAYGKKNFVLPVTFFDIPRNVKLLNKCKPLSIKIVDCKQHPTHYTKNRAKCENKSADNCVEVQNTCNSNSEANLNNVNAESILNISHTTKKAGEISMKEGEKKRRKDSFYEKLKKRKEDRKRIALNCKNLSQVDFKRNTGLVGLKITDTIFKKIVDTEKALVNAKCSSVESKPRNKNQNDAGKSSSDNTCSERHNKVVGKSLVIEKCISIKNKCADNNEKCLSDPEKDLLLTESYEDISRGNIASAMENCSIKKSTYMENICNDKKECDIQKENCVPKSIVCDKNNTKEKNETIADTELKTNTISVVNFKEKMAVNAPKTLIGNQCNPKEETSRKEVFERCKDMKKVSASLDNRGTSVILLTNSHTPKSSHNNSEIKSIKVGVSQNTNKDVKKKSDANKVCSEIRCSLKMLNKNALKLKKTKPNTKNATNTVLQQNPNKPHTSFNEIATNIHLKHSNIEGSDNGKQPTNSMSSTQVDSNAEKQVDKFVTKDTSRDQAGPNSPVIPCTTIAIRPAPPKSTAKVTSAKVAGRNEKQDRAPFSITPYTDTEISWLQNMALPRSTPTIVQKQSTLPQIYTANQSDLTNSECKPTLWPNEPGVSKMNVYTNGPLLYNQKTPNIKTPKITELNKNINDPRTAIRNMENNFSAINKRALSDLAVSNINQRKGADMLNTTVNPCTPTGNTTFVTNLSNGMINSEANPNQKTNVAPSSQILSKFSGHNAIILRRPPLPPLRQSQINPTPNQGQPIQTVVNNRFQYLPGPRPLRFHYPPPFPPPPPPLIPPNSHLNFTRFRPTSQRFLMPSRLPPTPTCPSYLRGIEMGLNQWRFYNSSPPPVNRPPLSVPGAPGPQASKEYFLCIGKTADGDPIKKINIPVVTPIVDDKHKMLAELNNAIMSPELMTNQQDDPPNDLKRKADIPIDPVKPKCPKPGPLSKKTNITTDPSNMKIPDKLSRNTGYSPPILPIFTYQESFKIFSPNDGKNSEISVPSVTTDTQDDTSLKRTTFTASIRKLNKNHKRISHHGSGKQDKAKKISFEDYRKRVVKDDVDKMDVYKTRKYKERDATDDHNQDQGYDSDSTVKL